MVEAFGPAPGVYLDCATPSGGSALRRQGEVTATSSRSTSASGRRRLSRAHANLSGAHYPMGGLWVDYHLLSPFPALRAGRANFSDQGATAWARARSCKGSPTATSIIPATVPDYVAHGESREGR